VERALRVRQKLLETGHPAVAALEANLRRLDELERQLTAAFRSPRRQQQ
jgi:hypothetical protein